MDTISSLSSKLHEFMFSNHIYVDKSRLLLDFISYLQQEPRLTAPNIFMVIRPRGFGLTLGADAVEALLMQDTLIIDDISRRDLRQKLQPQPVVRLSLKKAFIDSPQAFRGHLLELMQMQFWEHHINKYKGSFHHPRTYFLTLLRAVAEKHQQPAAVIIDNYDVPFLSFSRLKGRAHDEASALYLDTLNAVKQAGADVAFCLLTGHVKFELASLYSEGLPAVRDISSHPVCESLFGFTVDELRHSYGRILQRTAPRIGLTAAELITALERCYGGYAFSDNCIKMLCPASINAVLENEGLFLPWQARGDYTFLKEALRREEPNLDWLFDKDGQDALFLDCVELPLQRRDFGPLLLQLGFASIDKVTRSEGDDFINWRYRFSAPNEEMRRLLRLLRGEVSEKLASQPINPQVLEDGAHDYDL